MFRASRSGEKGILLVEGIIAVLILIGVAFAISLSLRNTIITSLSNKQAKKASSLADMVMERYDYLSSGNLFASLQQYPTGIKPAAFFAQPTNLGYDDMLITTTVGNIIPANGQRKLTVSISWGDQSPLHTLTFTKYLTPLPAHTLGGSVVVQIIGPPGERDGFLVSAAQSADPTAGPVFATTDSNGQATLNDVSADPQFQPMVISAKNAGTPTNQALPFSRGYACLLHCNAVNLAVSTQTVLVSPGAPAVVTYTIGTDFVPLQDITGTLTNVDDATQVSGLQVGLSSGIISSIPVSATDTSLTLSSSWTVITSPSGAYTFYNVGTPAGYVPSSANGSYVMALGQEGSAIDIPTTDPNFLQGYSGVGGTGPEIWMYPVAVINPAPAVVAPINVQVRKMGSLQIKTVAPDNVTPVSVIVTGTVPANGFDDRPAAFSVKTPNPGGVITLNNVVARDNESFPLVAFSTFNNNFSGYICPEPNSPGYYLNDSPPVPIAVSHSLPATILVRTRNAFNITGQLISQYDGSALDGMTVYAYSDITNVNDYSRDSYCSGTTRPCPLPMDPSTTPPRPPGGFKVCAMGGIPQVTAGSPPFQTYNFALNVQDNTIRTEVTYGGTAIDADTNNPISGMPLQPAVPAGYGAPHYVYPGPCTGNLLHAPATTSTNGSGNYQACAIFVGYSSFIPLPTMSSLPVSVQNFPVVLVDTATISRTEVAVVDSPLPYPYYEHVDNFVSAHADSTIPYTVLARLMNYPVTGQVLIGNSLPAAGVTVAFQTYQVTNVVNGNGQIVQSSITTDANGNYGPVNILVEGRSSTSGGTVSAWVPPQSGYSLSTVTPPTVPINPDFTTPIVMPTLQLSSPGGGL